MPIALDTIVAEFHENDDTLTEHICEIVRPFILHRARKVLSPADWHRVELDEIFHEALIFTVSAIKRYREVHGVPFAGYYQNALHWWFVNWVTRYVRNYRSPFVSISYVPHDLIPNVITYHSRNLEDSTDHAETIALKDLLEKLTPMQRDVFLLHSLHSYTFKEIAQMAGITRTAAFTHFHTARNRARALAAAAGSTLTPKRPRRPYPHTLRLNIPPHVYALPSHTPTPDLDTPCNPDPPFVPGQRIQLLDNYLDAIEAAI